MTKSDAYAKQLEEQVAALEDKLADNEKEFCDFKDEITKEALSFRMLLGVTCDDIDYYYDMISKDECGKHYESDKSAKRRLEYHIKIFERALVFWSHKDGYLVEDVADIAQSQGEVESQISDTIDLVIKANELHD